MAKPDSTGDIAKDLVVRLNKLYCASLPDEAWGEIDDCLCDAYYWGGQDKAKALKLASDEELDAQTSPK